MGGEGRQRLNPRLEPRQGRGGRWPELWPAPGVPPPPSLTARETALLITEERAAPPMERTHAIHPDGIDAGAAWQLRVAVRGPVQGGRMARDRSARRRGGAQREHRTRRFYYSRWITQPMARTCVSVRIKGACSSELTPCVSSPVVTRKLCESHSDERRRTRTRASRNGHTSIDARRQ